MNKLLNLGLCGALATLVGCGRYDAFSKPDFETIFEGKFEGKNIRCMVEKDILIDDMVVDILDEKGNLKIRMFDNSDAQIIPNLYLYGPDDFIEAYSEYGPIKIRPLRNPIEYAELNLLYLKMRLGLERGSIKAGKE